MTLALAHPTGGYYPRRDPLGAAGDFVTAPEISQLFGELIGLALVAALARSRPAAAAWPLVELGPGRGTLMADALRAARRGRRSSRGARRSIWSRPAPPCASGRRRPCRVCRCAGTTSWPACRRTGRCCWSPTSSWTPCRSASSCAGPAAGTSAWSASTRTAASASSWRRARRRSPRRSAASRPIWPTARCSSSGRPAMRWSRRSRCGSSAQGGMALLIDYGSDAAVMTGDTFRAVRRHAAADPLIAPGEADLSAHVDFRAHRRARRRCRCRCLRPARAGRIPAAGSASHSGCAGLLRAGDTGAARRHSRAAARGCVAPTPWASCSRCWH